MSGGNVQEEILFTINPENLISKFLCPEPMLVNESIIILGSFQYFNYSGYGSKFTFKGKRLIYESPNQYNYCKIPYLINNNDNAIRVLSIIVAIDATNFEDPKSQYTQESMLREIKKAYVGFSTPNSIIYDNNNNNNKNININSISTGKWGCGMFNGSSQLKSMLQWIAASLSKTHIKYCTLSKDNNDKISLETVVKKIIEKNVTVGQLWNVLKQNSDDDVFAVLNAALGLGIDV